MKHILIQMMPELGSSLDLVSPLSDEQVPESKLQIALGAEGGTHDGKHTRVSSPKNAVHVGNDIHSALVHICFHTRVCVHEYSRLPGLCQDPC